MKNFVSHAIDALNKKSIPLLKKVNWHNDAQSVINFCNSSKTAIHFSMPDGGKILNDEFKGIIGQELRLPFPVITIEYYQNAGVDSKNGQVPARNRLLLAFEDEIDEELFIIVISAHSGLYDWEISSLAAVIPSKWDKNCSKGEFNVVKVLPDFLKNHADEQMYQILKNEIAEECVVVMEFLEALSCKNVSHVPIGKTSKVMNDMRIRKGKTPFYETRELIVHSSSISGKVSDIVNTSNNPYTPKRQHLRRGHIRRLEKGNIWVNSCIVGSAELGVINKTYKIAA